MKDPELRYVLEFIPKLLGSLHTTLLIVAASMALGLAIGLVVALPRLYKVPLLKQLSQLYVSFFRGTPILILLFLIYYGLPELLKLVEVDVSRTPVIFFVILTYALHSAAYLSEAIRAAVEAVDRGQTEAAYAVGMTGFQAFRRVVLPQALAVSVPVLANQVIANLKDTSLAFSLGVMEMTGKAQSLVAATQHFIEAYVSLAAIYFVISLILERLFRTAERKLLKFERPDREAASVSGRATRKVRGLFRGSAGRASWKEAHADEA
ncbi:MULTISPECIES: amino acid ABC transporter permease [Cohnella]|uniref:amino acid ABC transporter permease n=1 Tax=Cohnella TaxID=329857 RepID=UPI0009BB78F4|nr:MULTISPECIES: amino acid ABC transporter permease [Cohnella]MBN2979802.1 amino acid ABC transporter permease [Cohnella algarum]